MAATARRPGGRPLTQLRGKKEKARTLIRAFSL